MSDILDIIEDFIDYTFIDRSLLETALTHASYANEKGISSYEKLEFLGDSILNLSISDYLYNNYFEMSEGKLSKIRAMLVCENTLSSIIKDTPIIDAIIVSSGFDSDNKLLSDSILADIFESIIGAVYVDSKSFSAAKTLTLNLMSSQLKDDFNNKKIIDYKSYIIEKAAKDKKQISFITEKVSSDNDNQFASHIILDNKDIGYGTGKTKKKAEQNAAKVAVEKILAKVNSVKK